MKNPNNHNNPNVKSGKVKHALKRGAGAVAIAGVVGVSSYGVYEFVKPAETAHFGTETPQAKLTAEQREQLDKVVTGKVRADFSAVTEGLSNGTYTKLTDAQVGGTVDTIDGKTITNIFRVEATTPDKLTLTYEQDVQSPGTYADGSKLPMGISDIVLTAPNPKHLNQEDILLKANGQKNAVAAVLANPDTRFDSFTTTSVGIEVDGNSISADFAGPFKDIMMGKPDVIKLSHGLQNGDPGQALVNYTEHAIVG